MRRLQLLEEKIGGRWAGVRFHQRQVPTGPLAERPMRLCEAIQESFDSPFILPDELLACPGARRSLGLLDDDDGLAAKISEATGIPFGAVRNAIRNAPRFDSPVLAVTLGRQDAPDIAVGYVQPKVAMHLVHQWQKVNGDNLNVELSTFMATCGNAVVAAHKKDRICLSFGCPNSRKLGIIDGDSLAVAIPCRMIDTLFGEEQKKG